MTALRIVGISGSLRRASYNRGLLLAAADALPSGAALDVAEIRDLPFFDEDVEAAGDPPAVAALKDRVRASDAVLLATPEYDWGVPGVLKNALDWLSRPVATNALKQKPVAIMGATTGPWGTTRAQLQLRQTLAYVDALVLPQPNVFVQNARDKFDAGGRLTDEATRKQLASLVAALVAWAERVRR